MLPETVKKYYVVQGDKVLVDFNNQAPATTYAKRMRTWEGLEVLEVTYDMVAFEVVRKVSKGVLV